MTIRRLYLLLLTAVPLLACSQDITGVWRGHFSAADGKHSSFYNVDDRYKFEVQIAQREKKFDAVTYSYLSSFFYGKAAAEGTVNVKSGKVLLQEGKLLEVRNAGGGVCIMTCFLQYSKSGDEEFLEGKYVSMNVKDSTNCGHGTVFLRKVASSDFYEEPFLAERRKELKNSSPPAVADRLAHHSDSTRIAAIPHKPSAIPGNRTPTTNRPAAPTTNRPSTRTRPYPSDSTAIVHHIPKPITHHSPAATPPTTPPLARALIPERSSLPTTDSNNSLHHKFPSITPRVLQDRSNQLVRSLTVNTREVVLNIYDDGIIDNDTISVYLDNKIVINHAMLTDKPLVLTLHLDEDNDYHELVLVADNEGDIPPNTSLMIVKAGDKEYKVNISSSLQKNATVTFKYVKPN
jgi:hypothetical protein